MWNFSGSYFGSDEDTSASVVLICWDHLVRALMTPCAKFSKVYQRLMFLKHAQVQKKTSSARIVISGTVRVLTICRSIASAKCRAHWSTKSVACGAGACHSDD